MNLRSVVPFNRGRTAPVTSSDIADPFGGFRREMDRLFDDFFGGLESRAPAWRTGFSMPVEVRETDKALIVEAELPGLSENDIDVALEGDLLTIRGEKKAEREEKEESYHLSERSYGAFSRSIRLPFSVEGDDVDARFHNGVLTLEVPKPAEAQQPVKHIRIKAV